MKQRPDLLRGETLPPKPRQKRSIAGRARIKASALAVFGERGYAGASIQEIAERAQVASGGFYQHFESKRQLLLVLMDELLEGLAGVELRLQATGVRVGIRGLLAAAFARDLRYLGAYRAWREAVLSDAELAALDRQIHEWTCARVTALFQALRRMPGARAGIDVPGLAEAMDGFFWALLGDASSLTRARLKRAIDSATHLIYHAMFRDV